MLFRTYIRRPVRTREISLLTPKKRLLHHKPPQNQHDIFNNSFVPDNLPPNNLFSKQPISKPKFIINSNNNTIFTSPQRSYVQLTTNPRSVLHQNSLTHKSTVNGLYLQKKKPLYHQSKRHMLGVWQNVKHMDWGRIKRNWTEFFVWLEEYKLGRYRADQKRMIFHARRTGGITPPFDYERNRYMTESEFLQILQAERIERFKRLNIWRKSIIVRRWAISTTVVFFINIWNRLSDFVTRFLGRISVGSRGRRFRLRKLFILRFMSGIKWPTQMLVRAVTSFFFRLDLQRTFTLSDLDLQMQNRVSGELLAKYQLPVGYSVSKYIIAFIDPLYSTFNWFHGARLAVLNVVWPLMRKWWFHINDYKPYIGFMKFGVLQWAICIAIGALPYLLSHFFWFNQATFAYKADFAHNYIALMTRAVYADILISLIEDGLIQVDTLTQGHDYEIHTRMRSEEFKFVDDTIKKRCENDPGYKEELLSQGVPLTLNDYFGVDDIPEDLSPKEQVLYILRQYNNYREITQDMLRQLRPLYEFNDRWCRIVYSLGLANESGFATLLLGTISTARVVLSSYRALLNVIGTRDGTTFDLGVHHETMIRALTRKYDLSVLPPTPEVYDKMKENQRPYAKQFENINWDSWGSKHLEKLYENYKKNSNLRPSSTLDVYHGEKEEHYNVERHGEHQHFSNLPSVTNAKELTVEEKEDDLNVKGVGKAFLDPYVATLLPSFHDTPLDYEMSVLQQIKNDLIKIASIHPEYKNNIPLSYNPMQYKDYIRNHLDMWGHDKIEIWEAILGRDIFQERGFRGLSRNVHMVKHAKWLHSQIVACIEEKLDENRFASPMYYIEGTCPEIGDSLYRSRVDTTSRFIFRDDVGLQHYGPQVRARDYQLIDPHAATHNVFIDEIKFRPGRWDLANWDKYDPRIDDNITPVAEDLGFWPGAQSILPFLGVNKYFGSNPMTGYIGMLVTSTENLMTLNRTAKERMLESTDNAKPKYNPFGQHHLDNDGEWTNTPPEDPRYIPGADIELTPGLRPNDKILLPTSALYQSLTSSKPLIHDSNHNTDGHVSISPIKASPLGLPSNTTTTTTTTTTATPVQNDTQLLSPDKALLIGSYSIQNTSEPQVIIGDANTRITTAEQEYLYRHLDHVIQRAQNSGSPLKFHEFTSDINAKAFSLPRSVGSTGLVTPGFQTVSPLASKDSINNDGNNSNKIQQKLDGIHRMYEEIQHNQPLQQYKSRKLSSQKQQNVTQRSSKFIHLSHDADPSRQQFMPLETEKLNLSSINQPSLNNVLTRLNRQLELHQQNPGSVPHPLPPRLPYEEKRYLLDSREERQRF